MSTYAEQVVDIPDAKFVPFALDTYGAWGDGARDFVQRLAKRYTSESHEYKAFLLYASKVVSFALQRGNGQVSAEGLVRTYAANYSDIRRRAARASTPTVPRMIASVQPPIRTSAASLYPSPLPPPALPFPTHVPSPPLPSPLPLSAPPPL